MLARVVVQEIATTDRCIIHLCVSFVLYEIVTRQHSLVGICHLLLLVRVLVGLAE